MSTEPISPYQLSTFGIRLSFLGSETSPRASTNVGYAEPPLSLPVPTLLSQTRPLLLDFRYPVWP